LKEAGVQNSWAAQGHSLRDQTGEAAGPWDSVQGP
jgi:hypothetical protein